MLRATLLLITTLSYTEAAKILCMFLLPFISHQLAFRSLIDEFIAENHEIDIVTANPYYVKGQTPPNLTEIDMHDVIQKAWDKEFTKDNGNKKDTVSSQVKMGLDKGINIYINQFACDEFQDLIKNKKNYDLLIADGSSPATIVLSHIFKAPFIVITTLGVNPTAFEYTGTPRHISYYPESFREKNNFTDFEKYKAVFMDLMLLKMFDSHEKEMHETLTKALFPKLPTCFELKNNIHLLGVNTHPFWEGIRPFPLNYVSFKFDSKKVDMISKDLQVYLDSSKNGVIYASFGTSVLFSSLPEQTISAMLRAFSKLPYNVLLKCDKDELPGRPINVRLFKWLPQADVLKHPKLKLFVTQGGQHSIDEAIEAGVPMVVIPNIFDQFANSERCVHHGIGVKLDLKEFSEEIFSDAIKTVIDNERYRENIVKLRSILQDNPMKGMDRLMWAIEYVIRHGGAKHMRSPSANISWSEYFELELLFYFLILIFVLVVMFVKFLLGVKRLLVKVTRGSRCLYSKQD